MVVPVVLVVLLVPLVDDEELEELDEPEDEPLVGGGGLLPGPSAYSGMEATASTNVRTSNCQSFFMESWGRHPW